MIHVLIPCHNNKPHVLELLGCLEQQSYTDFTVIVVDDGSMDGTEASVKSAFPHVAVLKGDGNLWWTGGNELGLQHIVLTARPNDFVLLLNNDVVVRSDYIEKLVRTSLANGRALVGSTLIDINDPSWVEGAIQVDSRLRLTVNRNKEIIEAAEWDNNVDVLSGRGTLVPMEVFRDLGGFNKEKLPHYGADYEFAMRAKRAGYRLVVCHEAKVYAKLDITGFEVPKGRILSVKECWSLLFSPKSKTNIIYYSHYVWLCSEKRYRLRNVMESTCSIVGSTVFATRYGLAVKYVLMPLKLVLLLGPKLMMRMIVKMYSFVMMDYPFMPSDIEKVGLAADQLIRQGILQEATFLGSRLLQFRKDGWAKCEDPFACTADERKKILALRRRSFNYCHKVQIDLHKIRIVIGRRRGTAVELQPGRQWSIDGEGTVPKKVLDELP
jgi:GT2 family glycosyltransferase